MRSYSLSIALFAVTAAMIGLVWGTDLPLGVTGEWVWFRASATSPLVLTMATVAIAAAAYLGFAWIGARRIERSGPIERGGWLAGLVVAGFAWLWVAQEAAPEGHQLSKAAWVLYYPGSSGYFTEARTDRRPIGTLLADYERRMSEGDVLHIGTHPPGLILVFHGLLSLCRESPALTTAIISTEPDSVRASFDELERLESGAAVRFTRVDRAVLWLAALLAHGSAALTVLPLYGLLRWRNGPCASWLAASFWPAVPAVALFLPKSDAVFPCFTALFLWLWISGFDRRSWWRSCLAGLTFWLGMMLSLAFLPIAFLAAIVTAWSWWHDRPAPLPVPIPRSPVPSVIWAAIGFAIPSIALRLWGGIDLAAVWWINLRNHSGFYRAYPRTYWKWLVVNPVEFAIAAGVPLVCLAFLSVVRQRRRADRAVWAPIMGFLATWGILWLSGKNMGEAARLWIFLAPCLVWIAAPLFETIPDSRPGAPADAPLDRRLWLTALALQLTACAALTTRVVGFQY